ncbi:hydrolase [Shewanella waksmanii]|uniref:hydrolase n=1 Tax=Shewanella waksmanii TaxID=213783 RepID=UPI00048B98A8|nr:hydrolase [Shewanella waksmanii]
MNTETFSPPWWAKSPHIQTILPVLTKVARPALNRQRIELDDGDFIDLDWLRAPEPGQALVVLLHGLEGSADSHYIRRMLRHCQQHNLAAVVHHHRNCSGENNRLARSYHSGDTGDIAQVLRHLKNHYPQSSLLAVGYSLGGNVLTKYLGEQQQHSLIERAVVVSAPLQLAACAERLKSGFSRVYQSHLIKQLQQKVRDKLADKQLAGEMPVAPSQVEHLKTFHLFDDQVTAPLHGFDGVEDYYNKASGLPYLQHIKKPTLVLHAADDPFMNEAVIPSAPQLSQAVNYELHSRGGHVGFISGGTPLSPQYYLEPRIIQFLSSQ